VGVTYCGWGLIWCWTVLTVWICLLGLIYLARFLQGRWRQMRVIEAVPEEDLVLSKDQTPGEPIVAVGSDRA